MQEKQEVNCNCINPFFNPTEKMLLLRKRDQEADHPHAHRRHNQSDERKHESEGKILKKSLKKRPNSQLQADIQLFHQQIQDTPIREEDNLRVVTQDQHAARPAHISYRPIDNVHFSYQCQLQPTTALKPSQLLLRTKPTNANHPRESHQPHNTVSHFTLAPQHPSTPSFTQPKPTFPPPKLPILQFNPQQENPHHLSSRPIPTAPLPLSHHHLYQPQNKPPQLLTFRETHDDSHKRRPSFQNSIIADEFDLLRNHADVQSHATLAPEGRPQVKPRDVQKGRRFEKQQLVGRLAESDEDGSDSAPSEVIGKGFDHSFKDLQDFDETYRFSQTAATQSTNTKASELHHKMPMEHSEQHIKDKFGSTTHFKSYRKL